MNSVLLCSVLLVWNLASAWKHPACDENSESYAKESVIDDHIARLMELRRPGWGWTNTPEVVLNLQLTKMSSFFGFNHTLAMMEDEMRSEINEANIGKIALYSMAVRASCMNERNFGDINLIRRIQNNLDSQWHSSGRRQRHSPKCGWYNYGLAIQALCVSGVELNKEILRHMLNGQNNNGSYGRRHSTDDTAKMLSALACVRNQASLVTRRNFRIRIEQAIQGAVDFLVQKLTHDSDLIWIGNKHSTPEALLALKEASGVGQSSTWLCHNVVKSLSKALKSTDESSALAQRLPAMRGQSVLALTNDWTCADPDQIPSGYQPTYDADYQNYGCSFYQPSIFDDIFAVCIDVRLSVQTNVTARQSDVYDSTVLVQAVKKDHTLLQVMEQAKCSGQLRYDIKTTSFGPYLTAVNGLEADSALRQYWALIDANTGTPLQLGIQQHLPSHNDHILFKLKTY